MNGIELRLRGRLGKDPELRVSGKGNSWVSFTVATDKLVGPAAPDGSRERKTTWVRVKAFNELAEYAAATLRKGSPVHVEGELELETWKGNDGQDRTDLVCIARQIDLDLRRTKATEERPEPRNNGDYNNGARAGAGARTSGRSNGSSSGSSYDVGDDSGYGVGGGYGAGAGEDEPF